MHLTPGQPTALKKSLLDQRTQIDINTMIVEELNTSTVTNR
jgi:hypothetical protein